MLFNSSLELSDGALIGIIGGGPAGTFTAYFMLEMAHRIDMNIHVDIYEQKSYARFGPVDCNRCGGVISESLVQHLATEGINLPPTVVQRSVESYILHSDLPPIPIKTPKEEMRIACVYRGRGPKVDATSREWKSFDGFLMDMACEKGAHHVQEQVTAVEKSADGIKITTKQGTEKRYDLIVGAVGVNSHGLDLFQGLGSNRSAPLITKTSICEIFLGEERVLKYLGNSMHVFLLDIPGLEFAACIPKGDFATMCLLGKNIDHDLVKRFLNHDEVRSLFPKDWEPATAACRCLPSINIRGARQCYDDRLVMVGDCGVSRLYKDGIGAAYRTAKACAITAIFHGVSKKDFQKHFWPMCQRIERDNRVGRFIFANAFFVRKFPFLRQAMRALVMKEQRSAHSPRTLSMILWNTFTGSTPYLDVILSALRPAFIAGFVWECAIAVFHFPPKKEIAPQQVK